MKPDFPALCFTNVASGVYRKGELILMPVSPKVTEEWRKWGT